MLVHHGFRYRIRRHAFPRSGMTPAGYAARYGLPTDVTGKGYKVAILELGGGDNKSAIAQFLGYTPNITDVSVDGAANAPGNPNGADGEVMLDETVIAGIARGATIRTYYAPNSNTGFVDCVSRMLNDGNDVLSISWGGPEDSWDSATVQNLATLMQQADAAGVAVFAAAGDSGSSDGEAGQHVDLPGCLPYVFSCGGTTVGGASPSGDTVWADGGGGYSALFPTPAYQVAALAGLQTSGKRGVPDVAGPADPATGWLTPMSDGSAPQVIGGTSAVAPMWAAFWALLLERNGGRIAHPSAWLYGLPASCFVDVTVGSNGAYSAGIGWDPCTGRGEMIGAAIAAQLGSTSPPVIPPPVIPPPVVPPPVTPPAQPAFTLRLPTTIQPGGRFTVRTRVTIPAGVYAAYPVPAPSFAATDEAVAE